MNATLATLLAILRYTAPAIVVLIAAYVIIKRFLVSDIQRKQIALLHDTQSVTIPMRLQAYERLTIYVERLHPRNLLPRVYEPGMTSGILHSALVLTINAEYEHNLSQQIYVSRQVWETVRHVREQELAMINGIATQLPPDGPSRDLQARILDYVLTSEGQLPGEVALEIISDEAKKVLTYSGS